MGQTVCWREGLGRRSFVPHSPTSKLAPGFHVSPLPLFEFLPYHQFQVLMHGKLQQRSNVCPKEATQPHCTGTSIGGQLPILALSAGSCATPGQWLRCSEHQPQPGRREVWRAPARAAGLLAGSRGYGSTWRCREERESGDRERKSVRAPSRGQGRKKHSCPGNTPDKLCTTAAGAAEGPRALLPAVRPLCPLPVRQAFAFT